MSRAAVLWVGALGAIAATALVLSLRGTTSVVIVPVPPSTSPSATGPATTQGAATAPTSQRAIKTFFDFAKATESRFEVGETPQESKVALTLEASAAVVTSNHTHIDRRGNLWITHPDAPPVDAFLKSAAKEQLILTRDEVVFVYWIRNTLGQWIAQPVTHDRAATGEHSATSGSSATGDVSGAGEVSGAGNSFTWHAPYGQLKLARNDYRFRELMLLRDDRMVVPTEAGVATLRAPSLPPEEPDADRRPMNYRPTSAPVAVPETFAAIEGKTPVHIFAVMGTAVAIRPWDNGFAGSPSGYRHLAGQTSADPGAWLEMAGDEALPPQPMHLFALSDGSTLVLSAGADAGMEIATVAPMSKADPEQEKRIEALVEALNASSAESRIKAANDIARFGPAAWPVLERLRDAQTPEAQTAINRLLGLRARPSLGVFTILPGPIRLIARGDDGTVALFAFGGVGYFEEGQDQVRSPALLIAPADRGSYLAHPALLRDRDGMDLNLQLEQGEVIVRDAEKGALRLLGNHLSPMLKPEWKAFDRWVGTDRRDRWVFADDKTGKTLILDRHLEDPKPRLPAWVMGNDVGASGWDSENHLLIERNGRPWRLMETGWDALDPEKTTIITELDARTRPTEVAGVPSVVAGADPASRPSLMAASGSATAPASGPSAAPSATTRPSGLLGDADPLQLLLRPGVAPPLATPHASAVAMLKTADNRFYFFDGSGKVLRMTRKDGAVVTDATFTENIPVDGVRRIWLDPFNRICIAHATGKATILFPTGRIPPNLTNLMPGGTGP